MGGVEDHPAGHVVAPAGDAALRGGATQPGDAAGQPGELQLVGPADDDGVFAAEGHEAARERASVAVTDVLEGQAGDGRGALDRALDQVSATDRLAGRVDRVLDRRAGVPADRILRPGLRHGEDVVAAGGDDLRRRQRPGWAEPDGSAHGLDRVARIDQDHDRDERDGQQGADEARADRARPATDARRGHRPQAALPVETVERAHRRLQLAGAATSLPRRQLLPGHGDDYCARPAL
ncbi:hypothetical protein G7071_01710 [Nocardioides piscis]|uniref:Uncharacterized protein n=1 Tax=Nocardioides piscis TaxID=2714938 RepID=A0A6G7YCK6_9ACTN|nr:hypothetical protein G7071_01710 [Nocardioides piscis]